MTPAQILADLAAKTNITLVILTMALLLCRVLPVIVLSPFMGGEVLPTEVKFGLGAMLGLVLFPTVQGRLSHVPLSVIPYIMLLMKELFVGVCISYVVDMVFQAAQVAGNFVDTVSGAQMAQVMVPQLRQNVSLFSSLWMQLSVVLFLTVDGHHLVINALADSFSVIPIDGFPHFSHGFWPFFDLIIHVFAKMFEVALAIAAPAFLCSFLSDLALGMMNRVAPQIQVYFISMQIKPVLVCMIGLIATDLILERMHHDFAGMFKLLEDAVRLLG
jgi:flagellar biosynthetic protein FliR